jgi:hypothetical protein
MAKECDIIKCNNWYEPLDGVRFHLTLTLVMPLAMSLVTAVLPRIGPGSSAATGESISSPSF